MRQLRKAFNDAEQQLQIAESKLLAANDQFQAGALQIVELRTARDQLLGEKTDLGERLGSMERAFKTVEIELVSVKTELVVKNQLLESLGHSFQAKAHG